MSPTVPSARIGSVRVRHAPYAHAHRTVASTAATGRHRNVRLPAPGSRLPTIASTSITLHQASHRVTPRPPPPPAPPRPPPHRTPPAPRPPAPDLPFSEHHAAPGEPQGHSPRARQVGPLHEY